MLLDQTHGRLESGAGMNEFDMIHDLVNLGAAGLMGVLWTWERMMSRQRERQLTEAHERLMSHRNEISALTDLAERNTRAITHFDKTQAALRQWLEIMVQAKRNPSVDIFEAHSDHDHDSRS
ncbi:MAG: hypothetical protein AAF328_11365 [Planctomycetota bacterium]